MDEARLELVRDWLTRASHDLGAARALAGLETPLDAAIYHCQQAAEKAVKGWLQAQDQPFPKSHDVEDLVNQAAQLEPSFGELADAAATLTPYVSGCLDALRNLHAGNEAQSARLAEASNQPRAAVEKGAESAANKPSGRQLMGCLRNFVPRSV